MLETRKVDNNKIHKALFVNLRPTPVAVETLGALGEEASAFFQDLGRRSTAVTAEPRSFQFLVQRLSVTLHSGDCGVISGA